MIALSVILLLALFASLVLGRSRPAFNGAAVGLVLLALITVGIRSFGPGASGAGRAQTGWDESVGFMLGRQLAKNHPDGGRVVILDFAPGEERSAHVRAHLAGLTRGWGGAGFEPVPIGMPEIAAALGLGSGPSEMMPGMLSRDAYAGLLAAHPGAMAAVSFLGVPSRLSAADAGILPALYALEQAPITGATPEAAVLPPTVRALVRFRPDADFSSPVPAGGPEAVFAMRYVLVPHAD